MGIIHNTTILYEKVHGKNTKYLDTLDVFATPASHATRHVRTHMHASCVSSLARTVPIFSPRRPITRVPLRVAPTPDANTTTTPSSTTRRQERRGGSVSVKVAEAEEAEEEKSMSMSSETSGPSVLVVGAGRVGTYLACKFANAGGRVVLKGSKNPRNPSGQVDALCKEAGVELIRDYDTHRDRKVDFVFISVKTYDLPGVKAELDEHGIEPRIAILVHNGIIAPLFDKSVRVVIPQSYDFVDCPGEGCGVKIHVKNEEKPWVSTVRYTCCRTRTCPQVLRLPLFAPTRTVYDPMHYKY